MSFGKEKISQFYPEAEDLMFEPMLIWKTTKTDVLQEAYENGEYFLEEKIDGYLEQIVKTEHHLYMFSRAVSRSTGLLSEKIDNVPHIKEAFQCLPPKTIIISEIYFPNKSSKDVTKVLGCLPEKAIERQRENPLYLYCHDIIMYDGENLMDKGAEERYNLLKEIWKKYNLSTFNFLRLAIKIDDKLEEETSRILNAGGEGVVLKLRTGLYTPGKRPAHTTIKVKQMDTTDLVCTGVCPATKDYTGKELETWPYWELADGELVDVCQYGMNNDSCPINKYYYLGYVTAIEVGYYDNDNTLVTIGTVSSGLTDELRLALSERPEKYIGQVVELDCMSISKESHALRHPIFKRFRDDKNPKEISI